MKILKFVLLLYLIQQILAYEWIQVSNSTTNKNQRYSFMWIPVRNFNFAPKILGTETIFYAPFGFLSSLDFTFEFCSVMDKTVKKDEPNLWNNTLIVNPCFLYFANDQVPYYLRGLNNTNNYTHLGVQQYCTYCESTQSQNFTEDIGIKSQWYSLKCTNKTTDEKVCLLYYPFPPIAPFTVYYYWSYQTFMLNIDPGLLFVEFFYNTGLKISFLLALFGNVTLIAFYFIPESSIIVQRLRKGEDIMLNILFRSIFTIKNSIAVLLSLSFFVLFCASWISWIVDGTGFFQFVPLVQGTCFFTSLAINLFCFTLVIIKWKQISEATNMEDELSPCNKILLVISFLVFCVWGTILVTFWILSVLIPTPGSQIYASYLFVITITFSILAVLVIIYSIILTRLYFGGTCSFKNMEAFKIYKLKFNQVMIFSSITLFILTYLNFYNGLRLFTATDIFSNRYWFMYRAQLVCVGILFTFSMVFSIVDFQHIKKGYTCTSD